jgi:hypothetical protein
MTEERAQARDKILQAVNQFKLRHASAWRGRIAFQPVLAGSRQIQQAVRIARHHRLVKPEVLEAAGYRAHA